MLLNYSKIVRFLRWSLPVVVVSIIASISVIIFINSEQIDDVEKLSTTNTDEFKSVMVSPKYQGMTKTKKPFTITADSVNQIDDKTAFLTNINARINLGKNESVHLKSGAGEYNMQEKLLKLDGGIDIKTSSGYEMHTNSSHVNVDSKTIAGNEFITGKGPIGKFEAETFVVDYIKNTFILKKSVKVVIYP